ncbi:hypothetical protein T11_1980 [Trichinella zimbabwensis]|uniref:Uncharacterized protein n=1 Tax=Trichinella zimbabwensis TaxID=268475 RepID=A0A0V1HEC8_9BILA|nr:hypothetical protein T11_1980 [Trichinella zimbabwensis]
MEMGEQWQLKSKGNNTGRRVKRCFVNIVKITKYNHEHFIPRQTRYDSFSQLNKKRKSQKSCVHKNEK